MDPDLTSLDVVRWWKTDSEGDGVVAAVERSSPVTWPTMEGS